MEDILFDDRLQLQNKRVTLSVITKISDADVLKHIAFDDHDLLKYSPSEIHTPETFKAYFSNVLELRKRNARIPFLIYDREIAQFAGTTSFGNISIKDKRLEIGWTWIGKKFHRTGLNRACKFVLLEFCFRVLGVERVEFKTDARNINSRRAIERLGATCEGALRSHTLMSDGYRRDTVYYSILKSEWEKIKQLNFEEFDG